MAKQNMYTMSVKQWNPFSGCNFKCIYCPYHLGETQKRQMTEKEAYRAIDEIKACGGKELEYLELNVLGEPLTHPNISEIIQYAHKQGIKIKLITNGSLLSLKNVDNILLGNLEYLCFPFLQFDEYSSFPLLP